MGLARALAVDPSVLLLDEPFGALDAQVRAELRDWLRRLHDETHTTTVIVTHDQEEAMEVADEVVVVNRGRIEQVAGPRELYEHPANEFVMSFVGQVNRVGEAFVRPHDLELTLEPERATREASSSGSSTSASRCASTSSAATASRSRSSSPATKPNGSSSRQGQTRLHQADAGRRSSAERERRARSRARRCSATARAALSA